MNCQSDEEQIYVVAVTVCVILATELYGWKIHVWDLPPDIAIQGRKVSLAVQTLYLLASGFLKMSILVSYLRFAPTWSWFARLTTMSIILIATFITTFFIVLWTQCM
jgi:hypothetical protein